MPREVHLHNLLTAALVRSCDRTMLSIDGAESYDDSEGRIFAAICTLTEWYAKSIGDSPDGVLQSIHENLVVLEEPALPIIEMQDAVDAKRCVPTCTDCLCVFIPGFERVHLVRYEIAGIATPGHDCKCHDIGTLSDLINHLVKQ